jgi:3-oxoacyl-[acyl-carrier protein] reductase
MDLDLIGRRALVCGGSRGLGAATATALAAEGARVAVAARESASLRTLASGLGVHAIACDLADAAGPGAAVDGAAAALGGLDLLLVNAGGPRTGTFDEIDDDAWRAAIDGTLLSAIRLIRAATPVLRASEVPAIVIILSSSVREPIPSLVTSNVLRPGLNGLVKSLVTEIAPIRINAIAPGRVATERIAEIDARRASDLGVEVEEVRRQTVARIPLGRYGEPAEVGRVITFLLSPAASYVDGVVLGVDGGMIRSLP